MSLTTGASCNTCRVVFENRTLQRQHFHSEWHVYNLKREIADLKPVKLEEFEAKVVEHKAETSDNTSKVEFCKVCNKNFRSLESYQAHIRSKLHQENVIHYKQFLEENGLDGEIDENDIAFQDSNLVQSEVEEEPSKKSEKYSPEVLQQCLFCTHKAADLEHNLEHMSLRHGFFIPEVDYCCNLQGLISHLNTKVYSSFECLWCRDRGKAFHSAVSVQTHMRDKCHCKLYHDNDAMLEYSDFYNYEYETSSDDESDDGYDLSLLESGDPYHLTLPSGAVIGHRSLFRYFKQNLRLLPPENGRHSNLNEIDRVVKKYKGLGWRSTTKEVATIRRKDQKFIQRHQMKHQLKVALGSNKLQRHYRDPNGY